MAGINTTVKPVSIVAALLLEEAVKLKITKRYVVEADIVPTKGRLVTTPGRTTALTERSTADATATILVDCMSDSRSSAIWEAGIVPTEDKAFLATKATGRAKAVDDRLAESPIGLFQGTEKPFKSAGLTNTKVASLAEDVEVDFSKIGREAAAVRGVVVR